MVYSGAARPMAILGVPVLMAGLAVTCLFVAAFLSHVRPAAALTLGGVGGLLLIVGRLIHDKSPMLFGEISAFLYWRSIATKYVRPGDADYGTREPPHSARIR